MTYHFSVDVPLRIQSIYLSYHGPSPLPTYTTVKQTPSNTLTVPTRLVMPKPTHPLYRRSHISHIPPTHFISRTTLIASTSSALDAIPEPRAPPTYSCPALITTTPPPHQHSLHPRTLILSQHAHIQH